MSGSGRTPVTIHFAQIAKGEGAAIALITRERDSALAKLAHFVLPVSIEATQQFGGSLFERTSLILLDAIVLDWMQAVPDPHRLMLGRDRKLAIATARSPRASP